MTAQEAIAKIRTWLQNVFKRESPFISDYEKGYIEGYNDAIEDVLNKLDYLLVDEPDVDLEKEVEHWQNMMPVIIGKKWLSRFARHFYELGQCNARKEDIVI